MHVGSGNGIHKKAEAICAEEDKRNLTSSFQKQFSYYRTSLPFVLERVVTFSKVFLHQLGIIKCMGMLSLLS